MKVQVDEIKTEDELDVETIKSTPDDRRPYAGGNRCEKKVSCKVCECFLSARQMLASESHRT